MNYDALMAFATFATHRNFTHAATELHISQPALHQKVGRLADEIGSPLYFRRGRELILTAAGVKLAAHAREVAALTENTLAQIEDEASGGTVILGSGPGALRYIVGPRVPEALAGPYALRLLTLTGTLALQAVLEARAQVAVGVFSGRAAGIERQPLRVVRQMIVVPQEHRLAERQKVRPRDLARESLIVPPVGHINRVTTERVLGGVDWRPSVEALGYDLAVSFVGYGLGLAIMNDFVPLPQGVIGVPMVGFPTITFDVAIAEGTRHTGARWLFELLLDQREA